MRTHVQNNKHNKKINEKNKITAHISSFERECCTRKMVYAYTIQVYIYNKILYNIKTHKNRTLSNACDICNLKKIAIPIGRSLHKFRV